MTKLLLDTHTFIWWHSEPNKLSKSALEHLEDKTNRLLFSTVIAWEMQIKSQLGKLKLNTSLKEIITRQQQINAIPILPVELTHVLALEKLPDYHKDPFDRLLVAQANIEDAILVSRDNCFTQYLVKLLW